MGEAPAAPPRRLLDHHAGGERGLDQLEHALPRQAGNRREGVDAEDVRGERGHRQHLGRLAGKPRQPLADDLRDGRRHLAARRIGERALRGEQPQQLAEQERVAAGTAVEPRAKLAGHRRAGHAGQQRRHVRLGQAAEGDAPGGRLARQPRQSLGERVARASPSR